MPRRPAKLDPSIRVIADNLVRVRRDLDFSQGSAAAAAGVGQPQLSRWETAQQKPEVDQLLKLAVAYQCSIDDFVNGVNDAYNALIERRIPVKLRTYYEAREQRVIDGLTRAARQAGPGRGPTSGPTAGGEGEASGTRRVTRVRAPTTGKKKRKV